VTNHADQPSAVDPRSFADLAADAEVVRRLLHLPDKSVTLTARHTIVLRDEVIPDRALALVAGLDVYGD
jgi:hypothetical protein